MQKWKQQQKAVNYMIKIDFFDKISNSQLNTSPVVKQDVSE